MMKRILAVLAAMMMLFTTAALAEGFSALTDDELVKLYREVQAEIANRWAAEQEEKTEDYAEPEIAADAAGPENAADEEEPENAGDEEDEALIGRLMGFFSAWSANNYNDMVEFCSHGWRSQQENVKASLFNILQNRKPLSVTLETLAGVPEYPERTATVIVIMDYNNKQAPRKIRMSVEMIREDDGEWYLNPESLVSYKVVMEE